MEFIPLGQMFLLLSGNTSHKKSSSNVGKKPFKPLLERAGTTFYNK